MTCCDSCGTDFPLLQLSICHKCVKLKTASVNARKAIQDEPQCQGCSVCYLFLDGDYCGRCKAALGLESNRRAKDQCAVAAAVTEREHRLHQPSLKQAQALHLEPSPSIDKHGTKYRSHFVTSTFEFSSSSPSLLHYPSSPRFTLSRSMWFFLFLLFVPFCASQSNNGDPNSSNATSSTDSTYYNATNAFYFDQVIQNIDRTVPELASALKKLNLTNTATGNLLVSALYIGNWTMMLPNSQAIAAGNTSYLSDLETFLGFFSYHCWSGNFSTPNSTLESASSPEHTIGRTLLRNQLEGNESQVVVWTSNPDNQGKNQVTILNQITNVTVANCTTFLNIFCCSVDSILRSPDPLLAVLTASQDVYGLHSFLGFINSTQVTRPDGTTGNMAEALSDLAGGTIFVPENPCPDHDAAESCKSFFFFIINGTSVYSPSLVDGANYTSAAGESMIIVQNGTGTYVWSGKDVSAKILSTDILAENVVMHTIDGLLFDTNSNTDMANSAYADGTASAGQHVTETAAIGEPSATDTGNDAEALVLTDNKRMLWTGLLAVALWAAAGAYFL
ncbi:hypothetical protein C8J56DRAFT_1115108 [Mycena floridula]|nr:hypothetical protein C8J56DRAFT_1115108 [Mycena floridula]